MSREDLESSLAGRPLDASQPAVDLSYPQDRRERDGTPSERWPPSLGSLSFGLGDVLAAGVDEDRRDAVRATGELLGWCARLVLELDELGSLGQRTAPRTYPPKLLTALGLRRGPTTSLLRLAWATWNAPWPDPITLRSELARPDVLQAVLAQRNEWCAALRSLSASPEVEAFLHVVERCCDEIMRRMPAFQILPGAWTVVRAEQHRHRAVRQAIDALNDDPSFREAWEVQRWGDWCEEPRVARFFPAGLCLLGLSRAGVDVQAQAAQLLRSEACVDGYRYYGRWLGIAPDADDLGLALQLVSLTANADLKRSLKHPVGLLTQNTHPDGWIPTYLERGLKEPSNPGAPHWLVRRCPAVAANALLGLAATHWDLPSGYFDLALRRTLEVFRDEGLAAVDAYPACYARLLLAELDATLRDRPVPKDCRTLLNDLLWAIGGELIETQELDGGWGSPLSTACHLWALTRLRSPGFDPTAACLYLTTRQEPDGMWPREALYHCPGRDGAQHDYASRSVTTALCLQALATASLPTPGA